MVFAGGLVVGGVEAEPADARDEDLDPGVARLRALELVNGAVVEIAADIAGGNFERAAEADHDMREILADSLAQPDRLVHGGVYMGGGRLIFELGVDMAHDRKRGLPGVGLAGGDIKRVPPDGGIKVHIAAGAQKVVALGKPRAGADVGKRQRHSVGRECRCATSGHGGSGFDRQIGVGRGDLEAVDAVAVKIKVVGKLGRRQHLEQEALAGLPDDVRGAQPRLIRAITRRRGVCEVGPMENLQLHQRTRQCATAERASKICEAGCRAGNGGAVPPASVCCCCSSCWRRSSSDWA